MNTKTINQLLKINVKFYSDHAESFSTSREYNWKGFEQFKPYLFEGMKISDIGCGNGRFAEFLATNLEHFEYTGVDSSQKFIDIAVEKKIKNASFFNKDILNSKLLTEINQKFDLIVLLGVIHHIPSSNLRMDLVNNLSYLLTSNARLVITFWNFQDKIDKHKYINPEEEKIISSELDQGDYLLTWETKPSGIRYAHLFSDKEITDIIQLSGLNFVTSYKADGKTNDKNLYLVLSKP